MTSQYLRILVLAALSLPLPAAAQPEQEQTEPRFLLQPITYEVVALFGEDTSKAIVNVHYRIGQNFFIFVRNEGSVQRAAYIARGELVVELLNEQKVSVARDIRQISLTRATATRETDHAPDLQDAISFSVPAGTYSIVFSLDDRESGRAFLERNRRVTATVPRLATLEVSNPILTQSGAPVASMDDFVPVNRGGNVIFGGRGGILSQILQADSQQTISVRWKLQGQLDGLGPRVQDFSGAEFIAQGGLLKLVTQNGTMHYKTAPSAFRWTACFTPLPFEKLEPGSFKLDIEYTAGQVTRKQAHTFRVVWPNKPFSLINPELALDALRHIATEDEIGAMQSGSPARRAEAFHRFWKSRDRDTTTAYNEVMAEYYYRVDEALRKFSTVREGDGYKTDRGRIYILYGPPQKTEKLLQPGGAPTEIWTYERLKRRLVFIDPNKNGAFVLSQTENL
jgi:GWxTD domain-containing protein